MPVPQIRPEHVRSTSIPTAPDRALRRAIVALLRGGQAHATLEQAVRRLPPRLRGLTPVGAAHSVWELVEHIRIAQWDILEFSRNPRHRSPPWPEGYWPRRGRGGRSAAPTDEAWRESLKTIRADARDLIALISDPINDLLAPLPGQPPGSDKTLLREALLMADHNAYHIAQIVSLRRQMGAWT